MAPSCLPTLKRKENAVTYLDIITENQRCSDGETEKNAHTFYDHIFLNEKKKCKQITTNNFSHLHIFMSFCAHGSYAFHTEFLREVYSIFSLESLLLA